MSDWKKSICSQASTVSIANITDYIKVESLTRSSIDKFYFKRDKILLACDPVFAVDNPTVTPLFLVGLISLVENYYRDIISSLLKICPLSKKASAEKTVNLASIWFGSNNLEKGALENISFSDSRNIQKNLKTIFNINVDDKSNSVSAPLFEFSRLCELRHAIVHSAGELSGKNAIKLNLPNSKNSVQVSVSYSSLQEAADVCTSLVCSSNLELFNHMARRWLHDWPKLPGFDDKELNKTFNQMWEVFFSEIDKRNGMISNQLSRVKARNMIIKTKGA